MNDISVVESLPLDQLRSGSIHRFWLQVTSDGLGRAINIPIMIAAGRTDGPVLGIVAALHGDELNGIEVIRRLFRQLDPSTLNGMVIGVPTLNVPSYLRGRRSFTDGRDLNRVMPGKRFGFDSEIYAHRLMKRLIHHFTHLIDLHTASAGRINPYYIRADMTDPVIAQMARLQNAQIIVHAVEAQKTLRRAAQARGIPTITPELCDPRVFQYDVIEKSLVGIHNVMSYLKMIDTPIIPPEVPAIECKDSFWLYADQGGILEVLPDIATFVKQGERIATLTNIFGDLIQEFFSPYDGIVIGKNVQPVNQTGGRILRLGIIKDV